MGHGSETQLQVGENLTKLTQQDKGEQELQSRTLRPWNQIKLYNNFSGKRIMQILKKKATEAWKGIY